MGYRVLDICYPTTADALQGFIQNFPMMRTTTNDFYVTIANPSINSSGVVTFQYRDQAGALSGAHQAHLYQCDTPSSFKNTPIRDTSIIDVTVIIAFIFAILIGFGHGISLKGFGK